MLQFLQPIWLWAISGIIIPLIIHLWNIKQGKVLKVGSIAFLQNSSKQYSKSFKVNEWLLLLLRCLLIIVASFLLAQPYWKKSPTSKEKGWLLIDKQGFSEGYKTYKTLIDSLTTNGFSFHYFNEDFTTTTLPDALKDSAVKTDNPQISYWDLITKLDKNIHASLPVYLITDNKLNHFKGERPIVETNIRWLTYLAQDSTKKHVAKAYLTSDDSIRLVISNSTPTATNFSFESLSAKVVTTNDYKTITQNGKLFVQYKQDSIVLVDTSTLKIVIYATQNGNDASYLKAAINAIQSFTKRKIQLQVIKDLNAIVSQQDWIFWLSEAQLPENAKAKNVISYAGEKEENTNSWINTTVSSVDNNNIQLLKRKAPATVSATAQIIWKDGFGNPVLTKEAHNQSNIYRFYNRFDPAWNNLVWDNSFPTLLSSIIFSNDSSIIINDKRIIDERQIQPMLRSLSSKPTTQSAANTSDISNIFWISLFIIFLAERLVSFRTKKADA